MSSYDLGAAQRQYDNRTDDRDDGHESHEMVTCSEAIDHLNSAYRAFGNCKDAEAMGYIQDMLSTLMENDRIAGLLRSLGLEKAQ